MSAEGFAQMVRRVDKLKTYHKTKHSAKQQQAGCKNQYKSAGSTGWVSKRNAGEHSLQKNTLPPDDCAKAIGSVVFVLLAQELLRDSAGEGALVTVCR